MTVAYITETWLCKSGDIAFLEICSASFQNWQQLWGQDQGTNTNLTEWFVYAIV